MGSKEMVEVEDLRLVHDDPTKKAVAVTNGKMHKVNGKDRLKWIWLPRSQITVEAVSGRSAGIDDDVTVTMPEWLAIDKELV